MNLKEMQSSECRVPGAARWGQRALAFFAMVMFAAGAASGAPKWTASTWSSIDISGNLLSVRYLSNWTGNDFELCDGCTSRFEYSGNRTVAWEFPKPVTLDSISIYTGWGDSGRDDLKVTSVSVKCSGDADWTVLDNSSIDTTSDSSLLKTVLSVFADDGGGAISNGVTALRLIFPTQENGFAGFYEVVARGTFEETPDEPAESDYVYDYGNYDPSTWTSSGSNMLTYCSSLTYGGSVSTAYSAMWDGTVASMNSQVESGKTIVYNLAQAVTLYEFKVYSRWGDSGRDAIGIVKFETQDEDGNWTVHTYFDNMVVVGTGKNIDMYSTSSTGTGHLYVRLRRRDGAAIATGVKAIRVLAYYHPWPSSWAEVEAVGELPAAGAIFDPNTVTVENDCWEVRWTARVASLGASDEATVNLWTSPDNVNFTLADSRTMTEIGTPYGFTNTYSAVNQTIYYYFETINSDGPTEWRSTNETASVINHDNATYYWRPDATAGAWEDAGSWSNSHNDARLAWPTDGYSTADFTLVDPETPVTVTLGTGHTPKLRWPQSAATVTYAAASTNVAFKPSSTVGSFRGTNIFDTISFSFGSCSFADGARARFVNGAKAWLTGSIDMCGVRCGIELQSGSVLNSDGSPTYHYFSNDAEILIDGGNIANFYAFRWSGTVGGVPNGHIVFTEKGGDFVNDGCHNASRTMTTPCEFQYRLPGEEWSGYAQAPLRVTRVNSDHMFGAGGTFRANVMAAERPYKTLELSLIAADMINTNGFSFVAFGDAVKIGEKTKKGDWYYWTYDSTTNLVPTTSGSLPTGLIFHCVGNPPGSVLYLR